MQHKYVVKLNGEEVGHVLLNRSGMFYSLICKLRLKSSCEYKLLCGNGEKTVDLGVCVPYPDGCGMERYIPVKQIGFEGLRFVVLVNDETFKPVCSHRPFIMLDRLSQAYFTTRYGVKGIAFQNQSKG